MGAEFAKGALYALVAAYGAHVVFDWIGKRGGFFPQFTDINANEFFPAVFTAAMIAGVLS